MKTSIFTIILSAALLWLSSCTSGRIASATEYDSVYFGKSDQIVYNEPQPQDGEDNQRQYAQDTDESRDDDFYYSRRVRRFGNNNNNNDWRYYDPYYSNDLYYSMGTPSWNTWNNNGWYNPTSPYIGSPWGCYNGMGGYGYGYGNGYNYGGCGYNNPYTWGGYNPWVSNYYGYSPWTYGYCGYNYGMNNPYYYSNYSPWNNQYAYYPPQSNTNTGTIMPNRGVTSGLAPATSLVNSGGGRPALGGRNNTNATINPADIGVNTNGGLKPTRSNTYTTPRSNAEFDNKPPRTYTAGELGGNRPSTSPTRTWNDTKSNTSPSTQPSNTNRPPVYNAPSDTRPNTQPSNTNRPPVYNTPKENTNKTPKSSWTPPANNSNENSKPSRTAPSISAPSSSPSRSGGGSIGGGSTGGGSRRPK